jgi:hypothetical protein
MRFASAGTGTAPADCRNLSAGNNDRLVGFRGSAGAIDDAHVLQRDHRRLYADEIFDRWLRLRLGQATNCGGAKN